MKMRIIVFFMLCWGLMSCLKDNGTYIYEKEPVPVLADGASEITVYCYGGDTARAVVKLEALGQDSAVTAWDYEWKLLDSVLCREKDLVMYSDDIFERINLTSFPKDKAILGVFSMKNKASGEIYQFTTSFFMRPKYWNGQWLILSENGSNSRLSYFQTKQLNDESIYELTKEIFNEINGVELQGKPMKLFTHQAQNISTSVGATLVVTEGTMVELNNETFKIAAEVKDLFLDGMPEGLLVNDLVCIDQHNYMLDSRGNVYKRTFTANYLGGKYINDAFQVDDKKLKVKFFGDGPIYPTADFLPLWDEANRRVLVISNSRTKNIYPVQDDGTKDININDMPEGTDVLYLLFKEAIWNDDTYTYDGYAYNMIYNDAEGKTWLAEFVLGKDINERPVCTRVSVMPFPGGDVSANTLFFGTSSYSGPNGRIFYAKGNEIRFIDRYSYTDKPYISFSGTITAVSFAAYADWMNGKMPYQQIAVGLENGEFFLVDIANPDRPRKIEETVKNVGGKIVSLAQIGVNTHIIE